MSSFLVVLALAGSLAVSLIITVPCSGALVRLRANYNPRGLQLDDEGNVEPHTGPVVTTFIGMLKRVKRIEVRHLIYIHTYVTERPTLGMARVVQGLKYDLRFVLDFIPHR